MCVCLYVCMGPSALIQEVNNFVIDKLYHECGAVGSKQIKAQEDLSSNLRLEMQLTV